MKEHRYDTHHIDWLGIPVRIPYEHNWLTTGGKREKLADTRTNSRQMSLS